MKILHTEASSGWGGQEIRILTEALGMRERGHEILFATAEGAKLAEKARVEGFKVYEIPLQLKKGFRSLQNLVKIIRKHQIDIVNTHSSADAWLGGIAGKLTGTSVIRTRHLSNPIKKGLNSLVLYNFLANYTATTCDEVARRIRQQARLTENRCQSIPTGVNPDLCQADQQDREKFRTEHGIQENDLVIGTLCVIRSWKGISELLQAAKILKDHSHIKWLIVGDGTSKEQFMKEAAELGVTDRVIFAGYHSPPYSALAAMDIFALLSTRSEGVSQATLQAAFLQKPLITTDIGGLPEICLEGTTGFGVSCFSPNQVAEKVLLLGTNAELRKEFGSQARNLVMEKYCLHHTLDAMEKLYHKTTQ